MSLRPTIDKILENIQETYCELRWMRSGKAMFMDSAKCFSIHSFSYFAWIVPLNSFLANIQKESLLENSEMD